MIEDWLNQLPDQSVLDVPTRLALIALVLVLTWIVQRVARWLIVLLVERAVGTFIRTGDDIQFEQNLSRELVQPTQLMVVAIGLRVALALAGLIATLQLLADRLTANVITIAVAWGIFRVVDVITRYVILLSRTESSKLDETIVRFGRQIAIFLILVFGVVLILQQWGQDVGALVAGLGIASLAVALAAQDTLANVIGYVAIVTDAPFKVGDMVIVEDIVRGRVQEISFRSTRIRTLDNSVMAIPNKTIANANVINWARTHKRRLDIVLGVTYSTTAEQIQQVLADTRAMLQQHELVTPDRIVTDFVEYGESSLNLRITFMVRSRSWEDLEAVKTSINLKLMAILKQHGVEVAFPTRTLHLESHVAHGPDNERTDAAGDS